MRRIELKVVALDNMTNVDSDSEEFSFALEAENLVLKHQVEDLRGFAKLNTDHAKTILGIPIK